jgi:hypothetical protein
VGLLELHQFCRQRYHSSARNRVNPCVSSVCTYAHCATRLEVASLPLPPPGPGHPPHSSDVFRWPEYGPAAREPKASVSSTNVCYFGVMELDSHVLVLVESFFAEINACLRKAQGAFNLDKRHAGFYLIHEYTGRGISKLGAIHRIRAIPEREPLGSKRIGGIEVQPILARVNRYSSFPSFQTRMGESANSSCNGVR